MKSAFVNILLSLVGSALYTLAFNEPKLFWWLSLVALVPIFFLIERVRSAKQAFWYGFLFGVVTIAGVLFWFLSAYPLTWAGLTNPLVGLSATASILGLSAITLGIFFGLWAMLFKKMSQGGFRDFLIAPSLWVLFEFARALAYSFVFAGSSSAYGPYWTFGFLGYPLAWSKAFIALAPLGGVYLLGFAGVAFNLIVFRTLKEFKKGTRNKIFIPAVAVLAVMVIPVFAHKNASDKTVSGKSATVAVFSTNFPARGGEGLLAIADKSEGIKKSLRLASETKPDIVILPEDSRALLYLGTTTVDNLLGNNKEMLLIDSAVESIGGEVKDRMFFYSPGNETPEIQEKHFLVPYGEYLPYQAIATAAVFGEREWVRWFNASRGYKNGRHSDILPREYKGDLFGALFCLEIIPENFYRDLARDGAGLFINVSSQAVFRGNSILGNQTMSLAKMKSAANGRYLISAGNLAPTFILNGKGEVVTETKRGENEIIYGKVFFNYEKTPYTRFGDWMLWVATIITIVNSGLIKAIKSKIHKIQN